MPNTATRSDGRVPDDLDRLVGRHARAGERSGVEGVDALGDAARRTRHRRRRSRRSRHRPSSRCSAGSGTASPIRSRTTRTRRTPSPSHGTATRSPTAITRSTPGADRCDDADPFVAGHERRSRLDRPVAVGGVDVGVAQPGRLDPHQHLARAGRWRRPVLDDQWLVETVNDGCKHDGEPPRSRLVA